MAEKFRKSSPRIDEVERLLSLVKKQNPFFFEIGCGNGRDAKEIVKRTNNYLGIDISSPMIEIAKVYVPEAKFVVADIETFSFPTGIDIIFAFASLLHSDKNAIKNILDEHIKA